jgi:hypothetical protein
MADLTSFAQTYSNAGAAITTAYLGANRANTRGNGLGGKTQIVALTVTATGVMSQAQLDSFIAGVTTGLTSLPPFVIAGISTFVAGTTETVYFALQGTDTFVTDTSDAYGATGMTATLVATFDQIPA